MSRLQFKHHLLLAGGFLVAAIVFIAARNWGTVSTMIDNATALNEGSELAAEIQSPDDFADYLAAHPEQVSLVAYDVGAADRDLRHRPDSVRALTTVPRLLLLAEYARQVARGLVNPDRRVAVDSVAVFALPGVTLQAGQSVDSLWQDGRGGDESMTVRQIAEAVAVENNEVASDWLWATLGPQNVRAAPNRFGLTSSTAPQSASGRFLAWAQVGPETSSAAHASSDAGMGRPIEAAIARNDTTHWDHTAAAARRLRADGAFRRRVQQTLRTQGTQLSLRQQSTLAQATGTRGTASDYAALCARIAEGRLDPPAVAPHVQALLERELRPEASAADSVQHPFRAMALTSGMSPGVLSVAGYARRADGTTRVVALFMDGVPLAVLYRLVQTGIDKGFLVQLLGDDTFFEQVRKQMDASGAIPT